MNYNKIIEKYNKELVEYSKDIVPAFNNYISNNQLTYSKIVDNLFKFYMLNSFLIDNGIIKPTKMNDPIMFIFAKSSLSIFGIYSCLKNGLATEGATLLRSMFEPFIDLKLILENDTKERLNLYSNYRHISNWLRIKEQKNQLKQGFITQERFEKVFDQERIRMYEVKYDRVKVDYHPEKPYHWAWKIFKVDEKSWNPSLKTLCVKLGLENEYNNFYAIVSVVAHSNPEKWTPKAGHLYRCNIRINLSPRRNTE